MYKYNKYTFLFFSLSENLNTSVNLFKLLFCVRIASSYEIFGFEIIFVQLPPVSKSVFRVVILYNELDNGADFY